MPNSSSNRSGGDRTRPAGQTSEARIAKVLAHPLRARILQRLGERVASPNSLAAELGGGLSRRTPGRHRVLGQAPGMDDQTRRRLLRAVLGEDQPGRGRVRRWTALEAAERAGLVLNHARRGLQELRAQDPPLVWGDVDARSGEELWWLLPSGLNELDRLEAGERR